MAVWWGVSASTTVWTALYYGIKWRWNYDAEWSCRMLTTCHAMIVSSLSALCCLTGPWPFTDPGGPNTILQTLTLIISIGYFIFDLTWCLYHQTEGLTMLIHHAVSLFALSRILMKGFSAAEAIAGLGGLELTNPLLQLRWFLRSAGHKNTILFILVEMTFMAMFFFMRMIVGTYLFYTTVTHPRPDVEAKLLATSLYAISWVFMVYIVQYFCAKYFSCKRYESVMHGEDSEKKKKS